jgi:hypothetical protein
MDANFWQAMLASLIRKGLVTVATYLVTANLMTSRDQESFVNIGVGIVLGGVALGWSWWKNKGQVQVEAHLKKMTGTTTVADANIVAKAAPATPPASVANLASRVSS